MCSGIEIALVAGSLAASAGAAAKQNSDRKKADSDRKRELKRNPIVDPEAERERVRERASRARQRAKGGFGTSDTLKGTSLGSTSGGSTTLLGGST